ncbi:hypothetical protein PM082_020620 [Marasmius tenuissimus]|nr:hypothetical protein PM082_020620 [Marasmius tenuissimus]
MLAGSWLVCGLASMREHSLLLWADLFIGSTVPGEQRQGALEERPPPDLWEQSGGGRRASSQNRLPEWSTHRRSRITSGGGEGGAGGESWH